MSYSPEATHQGIDAYMYQKQNRSRDNLGLIYTDFIGAELLMPLSEWLEHLMVFVNAAFKFYEQEPS